MTTFEYVNLLEHASSICKTVRLPAYCHSVTCDEIGTLVKIFSYVCQKTVNVTRSKHAVVRTCFLSHIFCCLPVMPICGQHMSVYTLKVCQVYLPKLTQPQDSCCCCYKRLHQPWETNPRQSGCQHQSGSVKPYLEGVPSV